MRHVPEGTLRRLLDEPLAVFDRDGRHLGACARCQARLERVAFDARAASRRLDSPADLGATERAWARRSAPGRKPVGDLALVHAERPRRWRLMGTSVGTGATVAAVSVVVAGVTAAATITTVFAPTTVAPLPVGKLDLVPLAGVFGLTGAEAAGGLHQPSGSDSFAFGSVSWSSSGREKSVASLADAEAATGLSVTLPTTLPNGVATPVAYLVQPKATATVTFGASAGSLSGSTLQVTLGPALAVAYGGTTSAAGVQPLGIAAMMRPLATSNGATTSQLEDFLLSQPGIPPSLAQELRLLGNLQTTLPIPTPAGTGSQSVQINGSEGVLISDPSNAASGVVWEDQGGVVHAVAGLLDTKDLLSVARQVS